MAELLHGDARWLGGETHAIRRPQPVLGGISSREEELELTRLKDWAGQRSLSQGILGFDLADQESGEQLAVLDLAWPVGLQEELSEPIAVLLNESAETIATASAAGFRVFTSGEDFKRYVEKEILTAEAA